VIFILVLLMTGAAYGQVNIEHYRGKMGVTGAASYSFNTNLGNVDALNSGGAGNITVNRPHGTLLMVFKGGIAVQGGKRFANNGVVHLRYTRKGNPVYQPEGFLQSDYAISRKLDWRTLVGAGLRFNLANSESASLSVGNALMWEREGLDLDVGDPHMDETSVLRSSSYINMHYDKRVLISMTSYAQFAIDDPGDLRLLGIAQLTTPIVGPLNQTTSINFRTDTDPPGGVKKTDAKLATSFGVAF